jgi:hypothetical protein
MAAKPKGTGGLENLQKAVYGKGYTNVIKIPGESNDKTMRAKYPRLKASLKIKKMK